MSPRARIRWAPRLSPRLLERLYVSDAAGLRESLRKHYAHTGRAIEAFSEFHRSYPSASGYTEKIVRIDQLIHAFHLDEAKSPVKSVASKLLEGNKDEVVRFLDRLCARDADRKRSWRETASATIHARLLDGSDPDS